MDNALNQRIGAFYDASTELWEEVWGEHLHHGYYGKNGDYVVNRRQAQIDLIEELLAWSQIQQAQSILDVGCGVGGSTLYLAQKFNSPATGITLSSLQQQRGEQRAKAANLEQKITFQLADALELPFANDSFDLVWSLESGEHMADKNRFLQECYRVLQPGGNLILATWCHRSTNSVAGLLTLSEKRLLEQIYQVYCLPYVISLPEYQAIALNIGFEQIQVDDWSTAVAPFWYKVVESMFEPRSLIGLVQGNFQTLQSALAVGLMIRGYQRGLIRFGLLSAQKPNLV
ncbi:methyltransferase domain-containing protein [Gloeocapsa sp. PCC 73106]|uniref:methyltransferase domain-containing protein n=1 Tax=Gloeocapsa sp. PCC 73106 TaxID=102232 RepID=UPI0002AC9209|nr:methyltransferase domain-containing protein [Gloeocapsa sp. PCC 73106]ELR98204.1 methyltransferase family protein [Gloeocapsa sp. PCC 73106]